MADLEIFEQAVAAPDALDVAWRPPTKNRERITGYKVPQALHPKHQPKSPIHVWLDITLSNFKHDGAHAVR